VQYHLILTRRCNLNCRYCHGGEETGPKTEWQYSLEDLTHFLSQDRDLVISFYGGEPTLRIPLLRKVMDQFPHAIFMLQTNALRLRYVPPPYIHRFHSILASIDGRSITTDYYRAPGVYNRVMSNLRWLRQLGYRGDVIARMTVSEQSDIYQEVTHLIEHQTPSFDHVHWQLNAIWSAKGDWNNFADWVQTSYNPGISKLIDYWIQSMEHGRILGLVPFLAIMNTLLNDRTVSIRCGAGVDSFAIHTTGEIGVCPIEPDWQFAIVGDIFHTSPAQLRNILLVGEPCTTCPDYHVCGGRCLFTNKKRLWGEEGYRLVCQTVTYLIRELTRVKPRIQELIDAGVISKSVFDYPEYNNGCEIIP